MPPQQNAVYRFGEFEVNPGSRSLTRNQTPVTLSRRSFDLLLYFVQNEGKILSKEELLRNIWPDAFVDENSLAKSISVLRKALDEGSSDRSFILTLPGRGYQFAPPVEMVAQGKPAQALAEAPAESQAIGILEEQRTLRTNISRISISRTSIREIRQDGSVLTARGLFALGIALAAVGCAGYLAWRHFHPAPASASVVLADFENTTGDKDFDYALNRAFQIELEQSPFLEILPRGAIKETLTEMQRKPDETLTPELAREVCVRNNAQAVLAGSISTFAGKYLLMINASSCVTGKSVAGYQQEVASKGEVLGALDKAAGRVRKQMGESAPSLERFQTPIAQATTASLEALRVYTQGLDASAAGDSATAQALFERAIALDADFASAYKGLSVEYYNANDYAKSSFNIEKAYALRGHTTERERLTIEIAYNAFGTYDYPATIAAMRLFNQMYPNNASNWGNLANMLTQVGEYPQAVEAGEKAWGLGARTGPRAEILARAYKRANRFSDAKRVGALVVADGKDTFGMHSILFQIAFAERDAARKKAEGEWGFTHEEPRRALEDLAAAAASEGKLHEAVNELSRARQEAVRTGNSDLADSQSIDLANLLEEAGAVDQAKGILGNQTGNGNDAGRFALLKAELGDMAAARKFIAASGSSEQTNTIHRYYDLPQVRAVLSLDAHQPAQAVEDLEPARPFQLRDYEVLSLRARAETEAGMLDRAAGDYQLILANQGIDPIGPLYYVAHLRLARVLVLQKKFDAARAEYRAFLAAWKDADPQAALLLQAKQEYAKLPSL